MLIHSILWKWQHLRPIIIMYLTLIFASHINLSISSKHTRWVIYTSCSFFFIEYCTEPSIVIVSKPFSKYLRLEVLLHRIGLQRWHAKCEEKLFLMVIWSDFLCLNKSLIFNCFSTLYDYHGDCLVIFGWSMLPHCSWNYNAVIFEAALYAHVTTQLTD